MFVSSCLTGFDRTALVMIVASDITTLKQRGKYNGFIGAMVGLGNGLGPLIGGTVTEKASWRWCFWYTIPIIISVIILLGLVVPKSQVHGKASTKFKMIDWIGLFFSVAAILLILVRRIDRPLLLPQADRPSRSQSHKVAQFTRGIALWSLPC